MRIAVLSDFETQSGGAAICATRLVDALLAYKQQVVRIVSYPDGKPHEWETIPLAPSLVAWGALNKLPHKFAEPYAGGEHRRRLARLLESLKPEVINVHNLHGAISNGWNIDLLQTCQDYAPVVWTLHDMWSFTGRCAFSYACEKYISGCDSSCPTPHEYPVLEPYRVKKAWQQRASFFQAGRRISAVTPSTWLAGEARKGFWHEQRVDVIPYGIPLDIYSPVDKRIARQVLGLDLQSPVLLLAGVSLKDRRKGVQLARSALKKIEKRPLSILTFGADPPKFEIPGAAIRHLGYIDHERTKALAYSSADIFVHPSLADNLPNTILEAIACGTPVIAFAVGGIPEIVRPGRTGWLAREPTVDSLVEAIENTLDELDAGAQPGFYGREIAEDEFSADLQAQRYLALFESII